jgi:trimeric autotransporter adhesin
MAKIKVINLPNVTSAGTSANIVITHKGTGGTEQPKLLEGIDPGVLYVNYRTSILSRFSSVNNRDDSQDLAHTSLASAVAANASAIALISVGGYDDTAVSNRITSVNNRVSAVSAALASAGGGNTSAVSAALVSTQALVSNNTSAINANTANIAANSSLIALISVGGYNDAAVSNRITSVNNRVGTVSGITTQNTSAIASVNTLYIQQDTRIASVNNVATSAITRIATVSGIFASVNENMTSAFTKIATASARITSVNENVTSAMGRIDGVSGILTTLSARTVSLNNATNAALSTTSVTFSSAIASINVVNTTQSARITSVNAVALAASGGGGGVSAGEIARLSVLISNVSAEMLINDLANEAYIDSVLVKAEAVSSQLSAVSVITTQNASVISSVNTLVVNNSARITSVNSRVGTVSGNATSINTKLTTASARITSVNTRVGTVSGKTTSVNTLAVTNSARITSVNQRVSSMAGVVVEQTGTGDGTTTRFTVAGAASASEVSKVEVFESGLRQSGTADYDVSVSGTTIDVIFTSAPASNVPLFFRAHTNLIGTLGSTTAANVTYSGGGNVDNKLIALSALAVGTSISINTSISVRPRATKAGNVIYCNGASETKITIDTSANEGFKVGHIMYFNRYAAASVRISAVTGVTVYSVSSKRYIADRYAQAAIQKVSSNGWMLTGYLTD